jgi:hypothetical protein
LAFQTLRRVKFIVEPDFTWRDFNPNTNFGGMAVTGYEAVEARYMILGKLLFFSVDLRATLAAPFTNYVKFTIPEGKTAKGPKGQGAGAVVWNAGSLTPGHWGAGSNGSTIDFAITPGYANYGAGLWIGIANGFIEIV